jgi:hypothetical protein
MASGSTSDSKIPLADLRPVWARWILPSCEDLFFLALFCLLVFTNLSSRLLGDAGIGWHIRTGQLILSTRSIPHFDPFSSSMNGHPWFAWEWLFDLIVGALTRLTGLNGVVVFAAFIIALTFWLALRWLVRHETNVLLALILVLLATCASMLHFLARPHVVTWLFTFIWFSVLDSSEGTCVAGYGRSGAGDKSWRTLWLLPLTMLFWVNLHGGFLIGFVLLAIFWVSAIWRCLRARQDRFNDLLLKIRVRRYVTELTFVGILSGAATLSNPYGFRLYAHIYGYLSSRFLMDHIDEFQSPNFHFVAQKCFAGLLLLTLIVLATAAAELGSIRLSHGIIVLFAIYSGLYASRNLPVSSLLLILVIAPRLSRGMARLATLRSERRHLLTSANFFRRMQTIELSLRGHLWPIAVVALSCWILGHEGKLGASTVLDAQFNPKRFPVAAVNYIENESLPGPLFSPDSWGGYLIYRSYPQSKVVVDDRHDFYGESFLRAYLKTMHVEPGWEDFLRQHPARCLVVPDGSSLASILAESPGWRPVYHDHVAIVFLPVQLNHG